MKKSKIVKGAFIVSRITETYKKKKIYFEINGGKKISKVKAIELIKKHNLKEEKEKEVSPFMKIKTWSGLIELKHQK